MPYSAKARSSEMNAGNVRHRRTWAPLSGRPIRAAQALRDPAGIQPRGSLDQLASFHAQREAAVGIL